MTVQSQISRADYNGNGATTVFAVPFYFLLDTDLQVIRTDSSTTPATVVKLVLNSDYTVSGAGNPVGGSITAAIAPTNTQRLSILRNVPYTQLKHYVPNDPFPAASHEMGLDKLTMEVQQLAEVQSRALTLAPNSTGTSAVLPTPEANALIGWNPDADALQNVDPATLATIVAFGTANVDQFSGNGATTVFNLSANPGALANLDVIISGVGQRAGIDYTWFSGTTLTFTTPPPTGTNNIQVRYMQGLPQNFNPDLSNTTDPTKGDALLGVKSTKTGAVATTQHEVNARTVSVFDFMTPAQIADVIAGTLTIDMAASIQAAINANVGVILLPPGNYKLASGLTWTKGGVVLRGAGKGATTLTSTFANGDVVCIGDGVANPVYCGVENLTITSSVPRASGAAVHFRNGHDLWAFGVVLGLNQCIGFEMDGGAQQFIYTLRDIATLSGTTGIRAGVDGTLVQNLFVDTAVIYSQSQQGVLLLHVSGFSLSHMDIGSGAGVGVATFPSVGKEVVEGYIDNVYCDTMAGGGWRFITNGGTVSDIFAVQLYASGCGTLITDPGVSIDQGSGVIRGISLTQPRIMHNAGSGLFIGVCLDTHIVAPMICDNGTVTPNTKSGIETAVGATEWSVIGGTVGLCGFYPTNGQFAGIFINTGNTNYTVLGVNVAGNTTTGVSDNSAAASGSISKCLGYVTQANGLGTINIASSSVAVTHGLVATPGLAEITIKPTSSMAASGINSVWVNAPGSTTFTVNVNTNVAGANFSFAWEARIKGT